jgi:hypothetical protein
LIDIVIHQVRPVKLDLDIGASVVSNSALAAPAPRGLLDPISTDR